MDGAAHYDRYVAPFVAPYTAGTVGAIPGDAVAILDHGAGTGAVTRALLNRGPEVHVTALDPSVAMLARLRDRLRKAERTRVTFITGTVADLPVDARFDAIASQLVIMFCPDRPDEFARLRHHARRGSTLVVSALGGPAEVGAFGAYWTAARAAVPDLSDPADYPHFSTSDSDAVAAQIGAAGFEVRAVRRVESWRTVDLDEAWAWLSAALPLIGADRVGRPLAELAAVDATAVEAEFRKRWPAPGGAAVTFPMHGWRIEAVAT